MSYIGKECALDCTADTVVLTKYLVPGSSIYQMPMYNSRCMYHMPGMIHTRYVPYLVLHRILQSSDLVTPFLGRISEPTFSRAKGGGGHAYIWKVLALENISMRPFHRRMHRSACAPYMGVCYLITRCVMLVLRTAVPVFLPVAGTMVRVRAK